MRARLPCTLAAVGSLGSLASALLACTQTVDVFNPPDAGSRSDAAAPAGAGSGGMWRPPGAGSISVPDPDDAFNESSPCGRCGPTQLCAVNQCVDAEPITALDTSFLHTCMVRGGQLFCWGNNDKGQLGTGDLLARDRPTRIGSFNDWLQVSGGESSTCALRAPGRLYCFGDNGAGELGLGDTTPRSAPVEVQREGMTLLRQVACGGENCCAIDRGGALYCWGANREGKVGQDDPFGRPDALAPRPVQPGTTWRAVDVGQGHVCAIRTGGELYCWGRNSDGALGIGSSEDQFRSPMQVGTDADWMVVSASQHHTCGVRGNGALLCWGGNGYFEVGAPELDREFDEPRQVGSELDWASVGVGWFHTCAIKRDQRLFCFGRAIEGQLGVTSVDPIPLPNPVAMPDRYARITLGNFHTCALDEAGALYCWGANDTGQLGLGDDIRRSAPQPVR